MMSSRCRNSAHTRHANAPQVSEQTPQNDRDDTRTAPGSVRRDDALKNEDGRR